MKYTAEQFYAGKRAERDRGTPPHYQIHKTPRDIRGGPALAPLPRPDFFECCRLIAGKVSRKIRGSIS